MTINYKKFRQEVEKLLKREIKFDENNVISWAWETNKAPEWVVKELNK